MQVETDQILSKMDAGFTKIHTRLDTIVEQTQNRQLGCIARFSTIEANIAVKNALNGVSAEKKAQRVAFQTWLTRGALFAVIMGVATILWKIFLGHIDLVAK